VFPVERYNLPVTWVHPVVGQTISHYKITGKLGEGGMGVVYRAEDVSLRRTVALKFPSIDKLAGEEEKARFVREAQAAAALNHPNICTVYEIGEAGEHPYMAMEFVEGESVKDRVRARPLPLDEALDLAMQASLGLQAAHQNGVVHRDIKSANLMVTAQGQLRVMDFGLAQVGDRSQLTKTGTTLGTPAYMSPEQAQAAPTDRRTDIWSLGVVLYEMLTGQLPFKGELEAAVAYAVLHTEPEPPTALRSGLPIEVDYIIRKALAKNRDERYQHIEEMLTDLRALQTGAARAVSRPRRHSRGQLPRRTALGAIATVAAALVGFVVYTLTGMSPVDSMAVLPFTPVGGDPDTAYLGDGLSENLITRLSRAPGLRMMSRDTAFRFKGQDKNAQQIGDELGVSAVLAGTVERSGDSLSISAELVDAGDGAILWRNQYRRPFAAILDIDQEIAREISQQLRLGLTEEHQLQVARSRTRDPEAYRLYLQGRYYWSRRGEDLRTSREYFQQAVDQDPGYALAWAGLADAYLMLGGWGVMLPADAYPRAAAAARRAIEMEETLAEPHATLGYFKTLYEWDWPGAEREFQRAIELNPQYATARHWYAFYLLTVGKAQEALEEVRRAQQADPLSPIINGEAAMFAYFARRYGEAVEDAQKALELDPEFHTAPRVLARAYALQGKAQEALAAAEEALRLARQEPYTIGTMGCSLNMLGRQDEARKLLGQLIDLSKTQYVMPAIPAMLYLCFGEYDRGFQYYDKALEERSLVASWLRDPLLDGVRSDPRFQQIFERIGLQP
jgi:serine/threonine-protein kinase